MRWFITKKHLVGLIGLLVAALIYLALTGCIPVTIRPQFDDQGLPIAIPVTPAGSVAVDGTMTPIYPVSTKAPTQTNWGAIGTVVGGVLSAFLAVYGINVRSIATRAKTALSIACELADKNAVAETDEDVARNKAVAQQKQLGAGVQALTQEVRGK